MDSLRDRRARAGTNPAVIHRVAALLTDCWDPASELAAPDGRREPQAHAAAVLGILAAGGRTSEVVGYMRRAEESTFGLARSTAEARWELAAAIEAIVVETPVAGEDPPSAA